MIYVLPLIGALVITLAMAPTSAAVQTVPYKLNFQGRLAGASGAALTGSYNMQFKLYTAVTGGTYVWGETRTAANANAVTVTNGLFSVMIGEGTAVAGSSASLEAAIATNQTLYLEVIVGAETLTPRNQLGSSAFAMNADKLDGLDSIDLIQNQTASAQAASFRINGSGTAATLSATTTINLGTASSSTGTMVLNNSGNANTVTLRAGTTATSYTLTLPTADGNTGDCLKDSNGSGVLAFSSCVSGDSISVNGTAATDANFLDTAATGTTTGVTFTLATAANPDTIAVTIGNASATVAGAITTGTQTLAGAKTFNDSITLAAAKTLNLTGGTTANRPASPTEGMLYYDTDTKQLLTYANGKWQADRSEAILVAASNSSVADKAAADYVGDGDTAAAAGDGDQIEINQALTAGAGKKVVLLAGTYTADATILIPNNTTLAGVGAGTLIQLADIDVSDNLIENSDTTTGTGVVIKDLRLDGQKALNTVGTQHGIYLNNMGDGSGATAVKGATITDVVVKDFNRNGIYLFSSNNNIVSNNTTGSNWEGIYLRGSSNNSVSGNITQNNYNSGLILHSSTKNSVTGNISEGNGYCGLMFTISSNDNTVTGNNFKDNADSGAYIDSSQNNIIANNVMSGSTEPLVIGSSSKSSITGNYVQGGGCGDWRIFIEYYYSFTE